MQPSLQYPFNVRSFFADREQKDIGNGIVLWRGWFQSVRPASGRMLINIDISTGTMYKPGPLIDLCLDFLRGPNDRGAPNPLKLAPKNGLPDRERLRLERFIVGVRIVTTNANGQQSRVPRVIKGLSAAGASALTFTLREGGSMTVARYFQQTNNRPLRFPDVLCVSVCGRACRFSHRADTLLLQTGSGALIPLEMCQVIPGQIMRKQVPQEKMKEVLEFATRRPQDRLASINAGLGVSLLQCKEARARADITLSGSRLWPVGVCSGKKYDFPHLLFINIEQHSNLALRSYTSMARLRSTHVS